jgi:hypothetical protein
MKSLETSLAELKKLHARYTAKVESLSAQRDQILSLLRAAEENALKTADAIAVLEGRPTFAETLVEKFQTTANLADQTVLNAAISATGQEIPQNGNLPPAESGMQWIKNKDGEDVLVPINPPKPLSVPGVTEVAAGAFVMPADDSWDSPESFLR